MSRCLAPLSDLQLLGICVLKRQALGLSAKEAGGMRRGCHVTLDERSFCLYLGLEREDNELQVKHSVRNTHAVCFYLIVLYYLSFIFCFDFTFVIDNVIYLTFLTFYLFIYLIFFCRIARKYRVCNIILCIPWWK